MSSDTEFVRAHERVLVALVGDERVAFAIDSVREVIDAPVIRPLPLGPAALAGHLTLRELHLPVLDAATLLGIPRGGAGTSVALVFAEGFALRVDEADDLWERDAASVLPVPAGSDKLGVLRALLHRGGMVAGMVDAPALVQRALATLREHNTT